MAKAGKPIIWTEEQRQKLGEELIDFVQMDHVFHLIQWTREKEKSYDWWQALLKSYPDLIVYHKRAKEILGGKLLQKAVEYGSPWVIQTFIPMYIDDVEDFFELRKDREHQRDLERETHKHKLNLVSEEGAKAKADDMNISIELMEEVVRLRKIVEKHQVRDIE